MATETIYTLNARDNIFFDILDDYQADREFLYKEINNTFKDFISILVKKNVKYQDLKNCLIPSSKKNEIAYVFDISKVESNLYGFDIFCNLVPLFPKQSCNSVLSGDFVGENNQKEFLRDLFLKHIKSVREIINYQYHNQFYLIYINNLTDKMVQTINDGLKNYTPYIGYFDLAYSSILKTWISFILPSSFIKYNTTIITANPEIEDSDDITECNYSFEENGYKCTSIPSLYFSLFLCYKIERQVYKGYENDTKISINTISKNVLDISDFHLIIEGNKLKHLLNEKNDNLKRAGIVNLTKNEIELLINSKIKSNYIYNLTFLEQYKTIKFNIIIEKKRIDADKLMKLVVVLEYKPATQILRLITMY